MAFAAGQCAGPVLAGVLSDRAAGVRAGLLLSVAVLVLSAGVPLLLRDHRHAVAEDVRDLQRG